MDGHLQVLACGGAKSKGPPALGQEAGAAEWVLLKGMERQMTTTCLLPPILLLLPEYLLLWDAFLGHPDLSQVPHCPLSLLLHTPFTVPFILFHAC